MQAKRVIALLFSLRNQFVNSDRRWRKRVRKYKSRKKERNYRQGKRKLGTTWCKERGGPKRSSYTACKETYPVVVRTLMSGGRKQSQGAGNEGYKVVREG